MDLRNTADKCDMCNNSIYELILHPQYKICALCKVYNKCKCCSDKNVAVIEAGYPYCNNCYSGILRLSIILPNHIYLSDYYTAQNYPLLEMYGIKQILTIGKELSNHTTDKFKTMYISIDDSPKENISQHFYNAHAFINRAPTLVHCYAGVSRSVSLVVSYLMRFLNMTRDEAIIYCKQRRPHINPNYGFMKQLKDYEKEIT